MLVEIARPVGLLLSILSLYAVFHTAFLVPATTPQERIEAALRLLLLAGSICAGSGLLFQEHTRAGETPLMKTLPMQLFCWATALMVVMFGASWYLETYCIFYKDVRF